MTERFQNYRLLRLFVVFVVVAAGYGTRFLAGDAPVVQPFVLLGVAGTGIVVAANMWASRNPLTTTFVSVQLALDTLFASVLCGLTGSVYSLGQLVYMAAIGGAAWLLGLPGAMGAAVLSSIGFISVLIVAPETTELLNSPNPLLFYTEAMFRIFAYFLMAGVTGWAAEALRREQRTTAILSSEHETVLERVSAGVLATEPDGRIRSVNPAGRAMFGDVVGRPLADVVPGSAARAADGSTWEETPGDGRVWMCSLASLPTGGRVIVVEDGTELARARREASLVEHFQGVATFAGVFAHEVRNPLAALSGCLQLIAEDQPDGVANLALQEAERLNRLVDGYVNLTRQPAFDPRPTDLATLALSVVETFRADTRYRSLVQVHVDADAATAMIDADRLRQALWNLLLNGAQAMPRGGGLWVHTRASASGPPGVELRVRDEGIGIAPADRERIFDPFFTTRAGGSGMGLALVHQVARQHGGSIDVKSPPEGGTEFVVWLPRGVQDGE